MASAADGLVSSDLSTWSLRAGESLEVGQINKFIRRGGMVQGHCAESGRPKWAGANANDREDPPLESPPRTSQSTAKAIGIPTNRDVSKSPTWTYNS